MDKEFWHQRWRSGQIGFHGNQVHWSLERHWPDLEVGHNEPVLVPLAGKSLDLHWLHQLGHPVHGVELDPIAVRDFFAEWNRQPQLVDPGAPGGLPGYRADDILMWQGDFFAYRPARRFRAFYDRAALIALPPAMRAAYISHLRDCLEDRACGLLVTLEYQQDQFDGPPFSVPLEEVSGFEAFDHEVLERRDVLAESPKFQNRGIQALHETVYRLQAV